MLRPALLTLALVGTVAGAAMAISENAITPAGGSFNDKPGPVAAASTTWPGSPRAACLGTQITGLDDLDPYTNGSWPCEGSDTVNWNLSSTAPVYHSEGYLEFTNDSIESTGITQNLTQPYMYGLVAASNSATQTGLWVDANNGTDRAYIQPNSGNIVANAGSSLTSTGGDSTSWHYICAEYNGASSTLSVNGTQYAGNAGSNALDCCHVGSNFNDTGQKDGDVAAFFLWDDGTTIAECETYLATVRDGLP